MIGRLLRHASGCRRPTQGSLKGVHRRLLAALRTRAELHPAERRGGGGGDGRWRTFHSGVASEL